MNDEIKSLKMRILDLKRINETLGYVFLFFNSDLRQLGSVAGVWKLSSGVCPLVWTGAGDITRSRGPWLTRAVWWPHRAGAETKKSSTTAVRRPVKPQRPSSFPAAPTVWDSHVTSKGRDTQCLQFPLKEVYKPQPLKQEIWLDIVL